MRCLDNIKKEQRTLVAFQALSELQSRIKNRDSGESDSESYRWRSVEERIERLVAEEECVVKSIEWLLSLEKRLEDASDRFLAIVKGLEGGSAAVEDLRTGLKSVATSLRRLASEDMDARLDETGVPPELRREVVVKVAERIEGLADGAGKDRRESLTADLDGQLNVLLEMIETVSAAVSNLEASKAQSEVQAANYSAMTADTDSMVRAARELGAAAGQETVPRVRKVS